MRASAPNFTLPACSRRQIDVHVDIGRIEHGEDLAAGGQDLADIGDPILDAAVARRDQRVVGDLDAVELDVVRGGVERMLELDHPQVCGVERRVGAIELLLPLIHHFLGLKAFLHQDGGAVEFLLRQQRLRFLLRHIGVRFVDRAAVPA